MGYPSTGMEGLYRNKRSHVIAFLQLQHGDDFRVYNLCSERHYPLDIFGPGDIVAEYPFPDHNPSPLWLMHEFIADAQTYLEASDSHVVAIHCKAGKGRTGLYICALLQAMGRAGSPGEALSFYGDARTKNGKGVTIPSQQRYVGYYGQVLDEGGMREPVAVTLTSVKMWGPMPRLGSGGILPSIKVYSGGVLVGISATTPPCVTGTLTADGAIKMALVGTAGTDGEDPGAGPSKVYPLIVTGDIKVVLSHTRAFRGRKKVGQFWFHASYLPRSGELLLTKDGIDSVNKSSKFSDSFRLSLLYGSSELKAASRPREKRSSHAPLQPSPLAPRALIESESDDGFDDDTHYTYEYEYDRSEGEGEGEDEDIDDDSWFDDSDRGHTTG